MTWRLAIFFSVMASAWGASISGIVEVTDPTAVATREQDHAGVVVWLESAQAGQAGALPRTVTISHKNKTFVPHILAVRTGTKVSFPNLDPFFHNAFSNYDGQ